MTTYECYECPNRHCRKANSQEGRPGRCLFDEQREANWRKVKIYWVRPELPEPVARELAAATSFPENYVFCGGDTAAKKQIGNAVPPVLAEALYRAVLTKEDLR